MLRAERVQGLQDHEIERALENLGFFGVRCFSFGHCKEASTISFGVSKGNFCCRRLGLAGIDREGGGMVVVALRLANNLSVFRFMESKGKARVFCLDASYGSLLRCIEGCYGTSECGDGGCGGFVCGGL